MRLHYIIYFLILGCIFVSCRNNKEAHESYFREQINDPSKQNVLFQKLVGLTNKSITEIKQKDSLAFLVLPIEAACPACRKKAIDSILKYKDHMDEYHFVVISGTTNRAIQSFFLDKGANIPYVANKIFIDSTNQAFMDDLIFSKPVIFYSYGKKVYLKVSCVPVTIKKDLSEFFYSARNTKNMYVSQVF